MFGNHEKKTYKMKAMLFGSLGMHANEDHSQHYKKNKKPKDLKNIQPLSLSLFSLN